MFTLEYIQTAANLSEKEEYAKDILWRLRALDLNTSNPTLIQSLNNICNEYDEHNTQSINYILSFVPKELKDQLDISKISGAFAMNSYSSENPSFHAQITLHLKNGLLIYLSFDNTKKCVYHDYHESHKNFELFNKYLSKKPKGFDSWLRPENLK